MIVSPIDLSAYPQCILPPPHDTHSAGRSPGVHLTQVIRDMAEVSGIGKDSGFLEEDLAWFACGGHLWEHVFDNAHKQAIDRGDLISPGEFFLDGVFATPDRVDLSRPALIELKCRWQSSRKFENLEKNYWCELTQLRCYCHMLGILEGDLIIFFLVGDWRPPIPCVRGVNLKFTDFELEETWMQILGHAKWRGWL